MKHWLTLFGLLAAVTAVSLAQENPPHVITISAKRFEFTPNEIHLKRGEAVTLRVTSEDASHGLYQSDLKIALDLLPGRPSDVTITPAETGRFLAICDHFCGSGHGNMKLVIDVE